MVSGSLSQGLVLAQGAWQATVAHSRRQLLETLLAHRLSGFSANLSHFRGPGSRRSRDWLDAMRIATCFRSAAQLGAASAGFPDAAKCRGCVARGLPSSGTQMRAAASLLRWVGEAVLGALSTRARSRRAGWGSKCAATSCAASAPSCPSCRIQPFRYLIMMIDSSSARYRQLTRQIACQVGFWCCSAADDRRIDC